MGKCQILLLSNAKSLVRYLREMLLKFSTVENNFISLIYLIIYLFCVCMWSRGERPLDILKAVWATAKLQHCTFFFSSTPILDFQMSVNIYHCCVHFSFVFQHEKRKAHLQMFPYSLHVNVYNIVDFYFLNFIKRYCSNKWY